jgi:hypothetical protein
MLTRASLRKTLSMAAGMRKAGGMDLAIQDSWTVALVGSVLKGAKQISEGCSCYNVHLHARMYVNRYTEGVPLYLISQPSRAFSRKEV